MKKKLPLENGRSVILVQNTVFEITKKVRWNWVSPYDYRRMGLLRMGDRFCYLGPEPSEIRLSRDLKIIVHPTWAKYKVILESGESAVLFLPDQYRLLEGAHEVSEILE